MGKSQLGDFNARGLTKKRTILHRFTRPPEALRFLRRVLRRKTEQDRSVVVKICKGLTQKHVMVVSVHQKEQHPSLCSVVMAGKKILYAYSNFETRVQQCHVDQQQSLLGRKSTSKGFCPYIQTNTFPIFAPKYSSVQTSNYNGCTI